MATARRVLIAGGLCGSTMLMASEKITDACDRAGIDVAVTVHNLWEGAEITGKGYDVVIEMFPYFENLSCPLRSGKPFISHAGEKALIAEIVGLLQ